MDWNCSGLVRILDLIGIFSRGSGVERSASKEVREGGGTRVGISMKKTENNGDPWD
jgi:hypothetical protein